MTFVSLVLIQFFKAYNFRSDRLLGAAPALRQQWLNLAIVWELLLLALIVYVPFLQEPFGDVLPPLDDWPIVLPVALTICPVLELAKWIIRRSGIGERQPA